MIMLSTSFVCYAQKDFRDGYIITMENDTIYGKVEYRTNNPNYQSCVFKKDLKLKAYSAEQLKGFGYKNNKYFFSGIVKSSFVEVLVSGYMSLYKFQSYYLVRKDGGKIIKLEDKVSVDGFKEKVKDNGWKDDIYYLIYDRFPFNSVPNATDIVNNLRLNDEDLTKFVVQYNNRKQSDFKDFKRSRPWAKVDYGVTAGVVKSSINIKNESSQFYNTANYSLKSVDPTYGLALELTLPRISENLAIQPEVYFVKAKYSDLVTFNGLNIEYCDTYIDLTTIAVPLSIKYSFPKNKYSFFVQGGMEYDCNIKSNTLFLGEVVNNHVVTTLPEAKAFDVNKTQLGLWGGVGVSKPFGSFKISANIRYCTMSNLSQTKNINAVPNRLAFSIIIFKK